MKKIRLLVVGCLFQITAFTQNNQELKETLIVFLQKQDTLFQNEVLPKIQEFTAAKSIELVIKSTSKGVPENITTTPVIIYQNYQGRSIYASRYMEFSTIKNFIRTSRIIPQRVVENCLENELVWEIGRTKIVVPLKITELKGKLPKGFSQVEFQEKVANILAQKLTNFKKQNQVCLQRTDRLFYFDLHPYLNAENNLLLSMEIYSQYSCKTPVFSKMALPIVGKFDNLELVFTQAAAIFEKEIANQMQHSQIGDAFSIIDKNTKKVTWETLNLSLPRPPEKLIFDDSKTVEMPNKWTFFGAIDDNTPIVQFRFAAPLDRYVGEIREINGKLQITENQNLMMGEFVAEMQSLTMGMESFDYNVLHKYVKAYKIPQSSFQFELNENLPQLIFGEASQFSVNGTFELMRKKRPVQVNATLTPLLDEEGKPLLQVSAAFSLNVVDDFGIKGPDGPDSARKTMLFDLNFLMK